MNIAVIIILCIAALLTALWLFTCITVEIYAEKDELSGVFSLWVKYLFFKKCITKPKQKKKKEKNKDKEEKPPGLDEYKGKIGDTLSLFNELKDDVTDILKFCADKFIVIQKIDVSAEFGLDDPMDTGIVNGLLYGAIYDILGVIHNYSHIRECNVNIVPNFNKACYKIKLGCILKLKNVHITFMIIKAVKIYNKIKKITERK